MTVTASSSQAVLPMLFTEVEVVAVERLSPTFVRVELGGADLADFGVDGPRWDQRIKLILPDPETGGLTTTAGADDTWFSTWLERPPAERGHMRTYTIRDVRGSGEQTTFVVDLVLHDLNLSARYADHLVAMHTGRIVAEGSPREVVTEEVVRTVFGLDNRVIDDPVSHTPLVVPVGRHQPRRPAASSPASPASPASQELR